MGLFANGNAESAIGARPKRKTSQAALRILTAQWFPG